MNISDIAKMAGVSPAAVSRCHLNQGYISEEKRSDPPRDRANRVYPIETGTDAADKTYQSHRES